MASILIKSATVINERQRYTSDVFIRNGFIEAIGEQLDRTADQEMDAEGLFLLPGCIDDQVHFREPGLTHKATIHSESRAAVAGGITSFMEMPNTVPNTLTQELLEDKYRIAARDSLANYSFFMGASNDNLEQVLRTDPRNVCGIKVFMGSSTGNMLVDNERTLEGIFANAPTLVAVHCEDEATIRRNLEAFKQRFGEALTPAMHPLIRSEEACYLSSSLAVALAKKHGSRLHVLHISTAKETELFSNALPLAEKKITAEACIHHLWFSDEEYTERGNFIKWNPAIKTAADRAGILKAVREGRIDVIATDHAPHTLAEKSMPYAAAPSGGPLVQHALIALLELVRRGQLTLEEVAEKMAHHPAICFNIRNRGFIREGYAADLVLVSLDEPTTVERTNVLSQCGWSPFEGVRFHASVKTTLVNGHVVYGGGKIVGDIPGQRLAFDR